MNNWESSQMCVDLLHRLTPFLNTIQTERDDYLMKKVVPMKYCVM
jgi:hypothetical protein